MGVFWVCAIGIVGSMTGFWFGRSLLWKMAEETEERGRDVGENVEWKNVGAVPDRVGAEDASRRTEGEARRAAFAEIGTEKRDEAALATGGSGSLSAAESARQEHGITRTAPESGAAARQEHGITRTAPESGAAARQVYGVTRAVRSGSVGRGHRGALLHTGREHLRSRRAETGNPAGKGVAAPVAGRVEPFSGGGWIGALLDPEEGKLYAPASGKITKLYPMGSGFLMRTDSGAEIQVQVAAGCDEMCSPYFRARVVQNEVVSRGKLLLEFDEEGLRRDGREPYVSVCVRDLAGNVTLTHKDEVRVGESFLWVSGG